MCPVVAAVLSVVDICHVISILADVGAAIEFILVGVAAGSELAGLFLCAENDNLNDKHPFVHLQMLIINSTPPPLWVTPWSAVLPPVCMQFKCECGAEGK